MIKIYQKKYHYSRTPDTEELSVSSWDGNKRKKFEFKNFENLVIGRYKKYKFKLFRTENDGGWRYLINCPCGKTYVSSAPSFSKKEAFKNALRDIVYLSKRKKTQKDFFEKGENDFLLDEPYYNNAFQENGCACGKTFKSGEDLWH